MHRRSFLALSGASALMSAPLSQAAALVQAPGGALTSQAAMPPPAPARRLQNVIVINGLGGIDDPNVELEQRKAGKQQQDALTLRVRDFDARGIRDAHQSGLTAVNMTLGYTAGDQDPFESSVRAIAACDAAIRRHPADLMKIVTAEDIVTAKRASKIGIIYGFQNSVLLGHDASRASLFADLGVRIVQLTYNPGNAVGSGSMAPENLGLTQFGREVVAALNASKILVDLGHSGEQTCLEAARLSSAPITISHTGCRALADLPRNKTDAELRLVAQRGGVVGIYFMPFLKIGVQPTAEDVVRHIEHAVNVCGEDHVGIGTDGTVTQIDDMDSYRDALREEVEARRKAGIGATGERIDSYPFILDLRGPNQFERLADLLAARGFKQARIEKILGQNFLRLMRDVWPA